ncbi:MAG: elongation factor 4, partial [Gemmatimonadetes bacterium]|nr:elongation factor 4 [Gemmatimonadota bacterium]
MTTTKRIRNFCIIAHIDHGKSTLADRFLELAGTLQHGEMREQVLDSMDLERERGITIKAHAIRIEYKDRKGEIWEFNLIDTPGHVDFSYEVSRSLKACEGALLVVDAAQGIEAQTIANFYLALESDLKIIPVLNKIDLPSARTEDVKAAVCDLTGEPEENVFEISAKSGLGVADLLDRMTDLIPAPTGEDDKPLQALVFDSAFDRFRGVNIYLRVMQGSVKTGDRIRFLSTGQEYTVDEVGAFRLGRVPKPMLEAGSVGYMLAGVKRIQDAQVGDTVTLVGQEVDALPGFQEPKPMVFSGLYPIDPADYDALRDALDRLRLNDAAITWEPETSEALGFGFRCGFLGMLHLEVVQERLEREYGLNLISTVPSVVFRINLLNGEQIVIDNPHALPDRSTIDSIEEPIVTASIIVPAQYVGPVTKLVMDKRGTHKSMEYLERTRVLLQFEIPLAEIVLDFYDRLQSATRGYASYDYDHAGYRVSNMVRLDLLVNGEPVDALSVIVHNDKAFQWGRQLTKRLKKLIPRQMYKVAIQAALGSKVIARETVSA